MKTYITYIHILVEFVVAAGSPTDVKSIEVCANVLEGEFGVTFMKIMFYSNHITYIEISRSCISYWGPIYT